MPQASACPDLSHYRQLACGVLAADEKELLIQHLEDCAACAAQVAVLPNEDSLVELLRQAPTQVDRVFDEKIFRLVERLSRHNPCASKVGCADETPLPANAIAEVSGVPSSSSVGVVPERYDFLAPPQAADELGRLGHYRILKVLGEGGMGIVFLAEEPALNRKVALKAMRPALAASSSARRRFLREAQSAAAVEHDRIVAIHYVGEDRGVPFLTMPLLPGESLDQRLKREERLPLAEVLRIGREIAEGLAAAHERDLIHRDVKPANLWLESRRGEAGTTATTGRVKILDFGLARLTNDAANLTLAGAIVGTPAYMAPEQARGAAVDGRCDLFSLGCVLYQMGTGQAPFQGVDTTSTLVAVATETPTPPRVLNPSIAPELEALILRLLAKEPGERPTNAGEVREALSALERGRDAAPPVTKPTRCSRRLLLASVAVLLPVLLVATTVFVLRTRKGTLEVTVSEPGVRILIDGQDKIILESKKSGRIELVPGEHRLTIRRGAEELYTESFTITNGDKVVIAARWTPKKAARMNDKAWRKEVAAMKPKDQVDAVAARLKELNPGFDGKVVATIERDAVTGVKFLTDNVTDLSPLAALERLTVLECPGSETGKGKLMDLLPLKGMSLKVLNCWGTKVSDLSPLKGMPLTNLNCGRTEVSDLLPLAGMKLMFLVLWDSKVSDLLPLAGMQLNLLSCNGTRVSDLSPLKGMPLKELYFARTKVSDLSPLAGMPLVKLGFDATPVTELSALKGMTISFLAFPWTPVRDLSPLKGMPLKELDCFGSNVADLSPLAGMKLTTLGCARTRVSDLSPLKGMPLKTLSISRTPVSDLSPLKGMKLTDVRCGGTKATDLSPLKDMPLKVIQWDFLPRRDTEILRSIKSLEAINDRPAAQFWKEVDAAGATTEKPGPIPDAWFKAVAAMPPRDQVDAVAAKLKERNPHFDGKVTAKIEGEAVVSLALLTDDVTDISPVRALKRLQFFNGSGSGSGKGRLADLSPLKGLPLTGLECYYTPLSDLTPLAGMNLNHLSCASTKVSDLAPLKDMPLTILYCDTSEVSDLSPLAGMQLTCLTCFYTRVSDLSPLAGMPLTTLICSRSKVSDLTPLKGMPLKVLWCDFKPERDAEILRSIETLEKINDKPAADFWKEVNAKVGNNKP